MQEMTSQKAAALDGVLHVCEYNCNSFWARPIFSSRSSMYTVVASGNIRPAEFHPMLGRSLC